MKDLLHVPGKTYFETVFGQTPETIPDIPPNDGRRTRIELLGKVNEVCFTNGVDTLRSYTKFPNRRLNSIAEMLWQLAGAKLPVALADATTGHLRFWNESRDKKKAVAIIVPSNFYVRCFTEPIVQMENTIYIASRVKDWHLGKSSPQRRSDWRAVGYNAELLKTMREIKPGLKLTPIQQRLLDFLPNGLDSLPEGLLYDTK